MDQQATQLADRFHQTRQAFLATIDGFTPQQMQAHCTAEQCTVSALASHMASVHQVAAGWIAAAAQGDPLPQLTMEDIDRRNYEQFTRDAQREQDAIVQDLRTTGERAEQTVRGLRDADLARTVAFSLLGGEATTQQLVEMALIAHAESHLASIRAAGAVTAGNR